MTELAGIGKSYRNKLSKVLERNPSIITPVLVSDILAIPRQESGRLLSRWCKNGWLKRLKRGAYIPVPLDSTTSNVAAEEPFLLADSLYGPGYIAGFSAVKHWDMSEQILESITYFTIHKIKDRNPNNGGIKFRLKTINETRLFGLKSIWIGSKKVSISDPSKTIIDLLDDPKIAGGIAVVCDVLTEYLESEYFNLDLLIDYATKMNNKAIFKRLGFLLETRFSVPSEVLTKINKCISKGYSQLDTSMTSAKFNTKWRLKLSESWKREYDRKK
jgi:predicted transcriptional regulator of viral defense system